MQIPELCGPFQGGGDKSSGGYINGEALFLFFLYRLSSARPTLNRMANEYGFGSQYTKWSRGFNWLAKWLYQTWGHKLENNLLFWQPYFEHFSEEIRIKVESLSNDYPNLDSRNVKCYLKIKVSVKKL